LRGSRYFLCVEPPRLVGPTVDAPQTLDGGAPALLEVRQTLDALLGREVLTPHQTVPPRVEVALDLTLEGIVLLERRHVGSYIGGYICQIM
jgi:hypothetical protein